MWGPWELKGTCSKTCSAGVQTRTRACNNPPPLPKSEECLLSDGTRGLDEEDAAFPCNLGSCEGKVFIKGRGNGVHKIDSKINAQRIRKK